MRCWIAGFAMLFAADADAAPTCLDKTGLTIRCATPGAMPVGWKPLPAILLERERSLPPGPGPDGLFKIALGLAAFFALIALLPDFDGHWDAREKDEDKRR